MSKNKDIKKYVKKLKLNADKAISKFTIDELVFLIKKTNIAYYNTNKPFITDKVYDKIEDRLIELDPDNIILQEVGADIPESLGKVKIPISMPSLDKVKNQKDLDKFKKQYTGKYVVTDKYDGISGELVGTKNGWLGYTRGNGEYGRDLSNIIPFLKLPKHKVGLVIRVEFEMKDKKFIKYLGDTDASNPRNSVSGFLNSDNPDPKLLEHIDVIAYDMLKPRMIPSLALHTLKKLGFKVVKYKVLKNLNVKKLTKYLKSRKEKSSYAIDGLVIEQNKKSKAPKNNPKNKKKFKVNFKEGLVKVKLTHVDWTPSEFGYLIPRLHFSPVLIGGVIIRKCSAFNAAFIKDNKLGKGSIVKIQRSGDVIPDLRKENIIKSTKAELPKGKGSIWVWGKSGVNIELINKKDNNIVQVKQLTRFFRGIGVEYVSYGIVEKLYYNGLDTVPKILKASPKRFKKIEGIQSKMSKKIYKNIHEMLEDVFMFDLAYATCIFGRLMGSRRIEAIIDGYPDIMDSKEKPKDIVKKIIKLEGFQNITAHAFADNLKAFQKFFKKIKKYVSLAEYEEDEIEQTSSILEGENILFTGFRNENLVNSILQAGGTMAKGMNSKTTILIIKDENFVSKKIVTASTLNIPVYTQEKFTVKYSL